MTIPEFFIRAGRQMKLANTLPPYFPQFNEGEDGLFSSSDEEVDLVTRSSEQEDATNS